MIGKIGALAFLYLIILIILLTLTITFFIKKKIAKSIMMFAMILLLVSITLFILVNEYNKIVGTYKVEGFKEFQKIIKDKYNIIEDISLNRYRNLWIDLEFKIDSRPSNEELMDIFRESKEFIISDYVQKELEMFSDIRITFYFNKNVEEISLLIKPDRYYSTWYYEDYDNNTEGIIKGNIGWD